MVVHCERQTSQESEPEPPEPEPTLKDILEVQTYRGFLWEGLGFGGFQFRACIGTHRSCDGHFDRFVDMWVKTVGGCEGTASAWDRSRRGVGRCFSPDPREDPKSRSLNEGSYKVPSVVEGPKSGYLLSRSSPGSG